MNKRQLTKLAKKLCKLFKRTTGCNKGHIHFMYEGKMDHLVLILDSGKLERIIAKSPDCKKGEYLR